MNSTDTCKATPFVRPDQERLRTLMGFMYEQHCHNGPGAEVTVNAREMELIIDELFDNRLILGAVCDALRHEAHPFAMTATQVNSMRGESLTDLLQRFTRAQSDVVCWLEGFTSAGKEYGPDTLGTLRAIKHFLNRLEEIL